MEQKPEKVQEPGSKDVSPLRRGGGVKPATLTVGPPAKPNGHGENPRE